MPDDPKPRAGTLGDRDIAGAKAARERARSHPLGLPTYVEGDDEGTGQHEVPLAALQPEQRAELEATRERRPTPYRIRHIERRLDEHHDAIGEMGKQVGELAKETANANGKLDILVKAHEQREIRETKTFTSTVEIETARELSDVEIDRARKVGIEARRTEKWKLLGKIVGIVSGAGLGLWKLIELIAGRL